MLGLRYRPPATLKHYMLSNAFGRLVAGPVGSGKTYMIIVEMMRRMAAQEAAPDGYRYTRWAIVRQTRVQIKETLVPDIEMLFQGIAELRISDSMIRVRFGSIRATILLVPMEDERDQRRLLSQNLTGVWISECIEVEYSLVGPISGRIGRFPSGPYGSPSWQGIMADTNFPIEGGDWHRFMENPPPAWQVFKQPGGMEPDAENLPWLNQTNESRKLPEDDPARIDLGRQYYSRLTENTSEEYVNRYVNAKYGPDPSGSAVYKSTFFYNFHVQDNVAPEAGTMLIIGQDFGRNPAAVIAQLDYNGVLLILEEVDSLDMGLELHLRDRLRPRLMNPEYYGKPIILVGDPAGKAKSSIYEVNEFDILKEEGFFAYPAPTNDPDQRIQAVESFLHGQRRGGPRMRIDRVKCPILIQGMNGSYRFSKLQNGELKPRPDKKRWSHLQDALQYICLVARSPGSYGAMLQSVRRRPPQQQRQFSSSAWT